MALIAALASLAACTKDIQNSDAVRSSIVDYLKARQEKTGLNMDMMNVDVSSVTFTSGGNEAHANVMFTPKAGGAGMQMQVPMQGPAGGQFHAYMDDGSGGGGGMWDHASGDGGMMGDHEAEGLANMGGGGMSGMGMGNMGMGNMSMGGMNMGMGGMGMGQPGQWNGGGY